jgi:hypothetical protein
MKFTRIMVVCAATPRARIPWTDSSSGAWTNAANWSSGVPSSSFGDINVVNGIGSHAAALWGAIMTPTNHPARFYRVRLGP